MTEAKTKDRTTTEKPAAQRLEHVNLIVVDLDGAARFLQAAFPGWRRRGEGDDAWEGAPRRWLHMGDDANYVTLNEFKLPDAAKGRHRDLQSAEPGLAHIGFEVADLDAVQRRLAAAGYAPDHTGPDHPHRRNVYYVTDEGLEFEFVEYSSRNPEEKNLYR